MESRLIATCLTSIRMRPLTSLMPRIAINSLTSVGRAESFSTSLVDVSCRWANAGKQGRAADPYQCSLSFFQRAAVASVACS